MKINRSFTKLTTAIILFFISLIYKGQTQVETYTYTGGTQAFTVPTGVTSVEIKAWGAGGGGSAGSGGSGGFVKATLPVTSGANLNILVGEGGTYSTGLHNGGYGGGGNAGRKGGSGGGYSAVYVSTTLAAGNVRVLAGGGGGGGFASVNTYGGPGGAGDAGDRDTNRTGGKKGTTTAGGAPGLITDYSNGATAGTQLQGGTGSREYGFFNRDYDSGGGGGGGGFYGGGGGYGSNEPWFATDYKSSGGGGGSNIIRPGTTLQKENSIGNFTTDGTSPIAPFTTESGYISGVGRGGAANSAGGNGLVIITYTRPTCSGVPTGGTTTINPNTGPASSAFIAAVTGSSSGLGLSYQWQISAVGGTNASNWTDIPGQTGETANLLAENLPPGSVRFYRRAITCDITGDKRYSTQATFTISSPSYCTPSSTTANNYYITNVQFLGTLSDTNNESTFSTNPRGYQDFTNLTSRAVQEQGGGINVSIKNTLESVTMAWVDWNQDGTFQSGEQVYTTGTTSVGYTIFGFTIPATQAPGFYRIRIRMANSSGFNSCENTARGEAEDYLFQVIPSCSAAITGFTATQVCGPGKVIFNFTTVNANKVRIYNSETDTVPFAEINSTGAFTTPVINQTTVYYATAFTTGAGGCESKKRIKLTAKVNPIPEITFDNAITSFCGDNSGGQSLNFSASGDKETIPLINENFDAGLGVFSNIRGGSNSSNAFWIRRESIYVPDNTNYVVLKPAIASGLAGDGFALANTATSTAGPNANRLNFLTTTTSYDTQNFLNLTLDFNMFTFFEGIQPLVEYMSVDVSEDGGTNWTTVKKYSSNIGIPNKWIAESLDLSDYKNTPNLKIRFTISAFSNGSGWSGDIAGIDAVRLYGEKPLTTSFNWSVSNGDAIIFNSDCTTPYNGATAKVCIKPSADLLLSRKEWTVKATATLSNGCTASGTLTIINNNRTWDYPSRTQWTTNSSWQPAEVPTIDKCVVVKTPVIISGGTDAFAKNIKIENAGQLTINGSLTVNDVINNTGTARNLIVKSDGNLKQIDDSVVNSTPIAVRRIHTLTGLRKEYNFISSPVKDQNMKLIFGDVTANVPFVTVLNELTNRFVNAKTADYGIAARGFSVREPKTDYGGVDLGGGANNIASNEAEYKGIPNNGTIPDLPLVFTDTDHGYNVVGNPYPSNLDIIDLYNNSYNGNDLDPDIRSDFKFWDNSINNYYTQLGTTYAGWSYAVFNVKNGPNGLGTPAPGKISTDESGPTGAGTKEPTRIVKVSQAFMVRALKPGASFKFNNAMRKTTATTFFGKEEGTENYYRLAYTTPDSLVIQNAISYFAGGKIGYGIEDSMIPNSSASNALFSLVENEKVIINGRPLFTNDDIVPLGIRSYVSGTYSIKAIDQVGIFANGQPIYLKDKELGILTDISQGAYSFVSTSGEFTNRFEIVYKPEVVLGTVGTSTKSNIQVYRDAQDFVVQSSAKKITSYELYDMSGRIIMSKKTNAKEIRFNAERLVDGAYVLKARLEDGEQFMKKLRK